MESGKKPSIFHDRGFIGSADELDEYGVWVKSEPEDIDFDNSAFFDETGKMPEMTGGLDGFNFNAGIPASASDTDEAGYNLDTDQSNGQAPDTSVFDVDFGDSGEQNFSISEEEALLAPDGGGDGETELATDTFDVDFEAEEPEAQSADFDFIEESAAQDMDGVGVDGETELAADTFDVDFGAEEPEAQSADFDFIEESAAQDAGVGVDGETELAADTFDVDFEAKEPEAQTADFDFIEESAAQDMDGVGVDSETELAADTFDVDFEAKEPEAQSADFDFIEESAAQDAGVGVDGETELAADTFDVDFDAGKSEDIPIVEEKADESPPAFAAAEAGGADKAAESLKAYDVEIGLDDIPEKTRDTHKAVPESAAEPNRADNRSTELLVKIVDELSTIKAELTRLKEEITTIRGDVSTAPVQMNANNKPAAPADKEYVADSTAEAADTDYAAEADTDYSETLSSDELDAIMINSAGIENPEPIADGQQPPEPDDSPVLAENEAGYAFEEEPPSIDLDFSEDISASKDAPFGFSPEDSFSETIEDHIVVPSLDDKSNSEEDDFYAQALTPPYNLDDTPVIEEPDLALNETEPAVEAAPPQEPPPKPVESAVAPPPKPRPVEVAPPPPPQKPETVAAPPPASKAEANAPSSATGSEATAPSAQDAQDPVESQRFKKELQVVLSYMDRLLESLPDEKIEEFARSKQFEIYKKVFKELGLV
jgi:hypothetical protein